ncbi:TPA: DUF58 domain-containing protein [Candidatus Woesearchaeota archaeon]|nr:hypothetical protein QT06_C0001G0961 [archaeon GW2011_AR15]MBS3104564.1 DUF58 domain-containing protein [Candidatus Woesearchaeota archaeon]HIH41121.1 DUF58 domain-containing protein [Candidatus Woesearchaeota archaeon]
MIDTAFLSQLKRFHIIVNKKVTSSFTGSRRSHSAGQGIVISDFRPYTPGDDFRAIDWKVYARTDEFFIKRYEEEKNLTTHVLLDASKSMDYGTAKRTKFEYASMLALGFAYLSMRDNERYTLSLISDKTDYLRAKRSSNQILGFLNHLNKIKCKGVIRFEEEVKKYRKSIKSKSLVVIISDFLFDVEQIKSTLHLFKHHEVKVIQILDQSETNFKVYGSVILEDAETGKELETYVTEQKRQEFRERLYKHITEIEHETKSIGGKFFLFSTEEPLFDAFYRIVNT